MNQLNLLADLEKALHELWLQLDSNGLCLRGIAQLDISDEKRLPPFLKQQLQATTDVATVTVVVVGHLGSRIWPSFSTSPEASANLPHPLDAWSQRIGRAVALRFPAPYGAVPVFPSDGPPYAPFLTWSQQAIALETSPLGLQLDPVAGLWHAYRFALLIANLPEPALQYLKAKQLEATGLIEDELLAPGCSQCQEQPCLSACPVNAFQANFYDMQSCADYLNDSLESQEAACISQSCLARRACPVGVAYTYEPAHRQFHMQAFMKAHKATE